MSEGFDRILLVTPHAWDVPHPVNDHVAELATGLLEARTTARNVPDVVVVAPSHEARARRLARRSLRDLARQVPADAVFADPALRATNVVGKRGGPSGDFALLALGLAIGQVSVAQRSNMKLLLDRGEIGLIYVHDPLDSDLTRHLVRRWPGLTAAMFHDVPESHSLRAITTPLRERILDAIDLRLVPTEALREPLAQSLGGDATAIAVVDTSPAAPLTGPQLEGIEARRPDPAIVFGRGADDDALLRRALRDLRRDSDGAGEADATATPRDLTLLARWQTHHRPTTPRSLRGHLRAIQAPTREQADAVLVGARGYVAFPGTPARARAEAVAAGLPIVEVTADDIATLPERLLNLPACTAPTTRPPAALAQALLASADTLLSRRRVHIAPPAAAARTCIIDLHMHTNHSWDCATDPEALLHVAQKVGLTAIAVTDHNEISGALACASLADEYGVQVIVGEEVKTSQGEVIGLFLYEKIEGGLTWDETIRQIRAQDGLVYVPHPFDRLHTIPDVHTLRASLDEIDAFETYNARLTFEQYNRDAERFARKYNLIEGAGSDAHVVQGLGTAAVHMPAWDDPESFLTALRQGEIHKRPKSLFYLQGLKLLDTVTGKTKQSPAAAIE